MASNPGSPNPSATGDTNIHTNIPPRPHNDNGGEGSAPSSPSKVDAEVSENSHTFFLTC